ncbi:MATE family efflux transporter [Acidocella sp.]|uniref:MATE family efflux transporter n=1 Tax=Acidocella sp. TaxID=50710 RepID=UPI003D0315BF
MTLIWLAIFVPPAALAGRRKIRPLNSMTTPPAITHRAILAIAVPMMFAYLSTALEGSIATSAIGQLGVASLSAGIAIAAILFDILLVSLNFLRSTALGLSAIALGAGKIQEARAVIQRSLVLAFLLGLVIALFRGPEARYGLSWLGGQGPVLQAAVDYALIRALSAPFALGNYAILGALLGHGKAMAGLALQLLLNAVNIAVCLSAVLVLHWGIKGAAWASVAGESTAFLAGIVWLHCLAGPLYRGFSDALRHGWGWRQMGRLNRDTLIRTVALLFSFAFFTRQGASLGTAVLAANAIHLQFFALASNGLDGFAAAAEQFAGRMLGAGNARGFRRAVRLTLGWSLAMGALLSLVYLRFGRDFIALLSQVPQIRAAAAASLVWAALVPLIAAPAFQLDGVFIGATWSRDMRNMMLLSLAIFIAGWALLMPRLGNAGLWLAFLIFLGARGLTLGAVLPARLRLHFQTLGA